MTLLKSKDPITAQIINKGFKNWEDLTDYIQSLPYGRNSNRTDLNLVLKEKKGTCSSKHAFLKMIADLNEIKNIHLILGMYKMNQLNTPQIGTVMVDNDLDFIPEAHCYLNINNINKDFTNPQSDFAQLKDYIIKEVKIQPEDVAQFKVQYHKDFIKNWIIEHKIPYNLKKKMVIKRALYSKLK